MLFRAACAFAEAVMDWASLTYESAAFPASMSSFEKLAKFTEFNKYFDKCDIEVNDTKNYKDSDQARWNQITPSQRLLEVYQFKRPYPEIDVTPEIRQQADQGHRRL